MEYLNRRDFLRVAAGSAVLLPGLLAACTPSAPATPTRAAGGGTPAKTGNAAALPTFIPLQNGPKPDYASAGQQYEDGWDNYPTNPIKAWTKAPPGAGGTLNALSNGFNPPATPFDQNSAWQEVNK